MSIRIEVWGPYACFSRPEMKTERVSYDVITPSAARGLIEAIYWHPGMKYHIDKIHVLNPIRFATIRRNEVKSTVLASNARTAMKTGRPLALYTPEDIQQRAAMVLQDVHYVIEAHFTLTEKAAPGDNAGNFRISCAGGSTAGSFITNHASAAGSFRPIFVNGRLRRSPPLP